LYVALSVFKPLSFSLKLRVKAAYCFSGLHTRKNNVLTYWYRFCWFRLCFPLFKCDWEHEIKQFAFSLINQSKNGSTETHLRKVKSLTLI